MEFDSTSAAHGPLTVAVEAQSSMAPQRRGRTHKDLQRLFRAPQEPAMELETASLDLDCSKRASLAPDR